MEVKSKTSNDRLGFKKSISNNDIRIEIFSRELGWLGRIMVLRGNPTRYKVQSILEDNPIYAYKLDEAKDYFLKNKERLVALKRIKKECVEEFIDHNLLSTAEEYNYFHPDIDNNSGFYFPRRI